MSVYGKSCPSNSERNLGHHLGIRLKWNKPMPGPGQNAVFMMSSWFTGICQYPLWRSNVENMADIGSDSGYASFVVCLFSSQLSTHSLMSSDFFGTTTTGAIQGLLLSRCCPGLAFPGSALQLVPCSVLGSIEVVHALGSQWLEHSAVQLWFSRGSI